MDSSILNSTKRALNLDPSYTAFDGDIMMHINTVFTTLVQLGIGPVNGFMIEDDKAVWSDFLGDDLNLNSVKTYMYLRVRLLFDIPTSSFAVQAMEKQVQELEWRLNHHRECIQAAQPILTVIEDE